MFEFNSLATEDLSGELCFLPYLVLVKITQISPVQSKVTSKGSLLQRRRVRVDMEIRRPRWLHSRYGTLDMSLHF